MKHKHEYKTVWLSDIHLGTRGCQSKHLLKFLKSIDCQNLYLIGDIIDGWQIKRGCYFPQDHINVIRQILKMAKNGTKVYYIIGNHDAFFRKYIDLDIDLKMGDNIIIADEFDYVIGDKKYLVTHGDKYDIITTYHTWIAHIGDNLYTFAILLNTILNQFRVHLGLEYWSLSQYLKNHVKSALDFIFEFEKSLIGHAKAHDYDGVFCGHIHYPVIKEIDGIEYLNTGDWVESCSALVSDFDDNITLIHPTENNNNK